MGLKQLYLIAYNAVAFAAWGYVLYLTFQTIARHTVGGESNICGAAAALDLWETVSGPLKFAQTLALLELVHSIMKLVPSPLGSALPQVASRLILLWGFTNTSVAAQSHWSLYLMIASWSLVEVPRYMFYVLNLVLAQVPYPVFFLRYNLFMVLYPTGITGELFQVFRTMPALKESSLLAWYGALVWVLLYIPGSPYLYMHMIGQKRAAANKRTQGARAAPPVNGIEFPKDSKGERSTTVINQGAFVASIANVDARAAEEAKKTRNWRFGYTKHVVRNVELSAKSTDNCLKIAQAGLDYLHNSFEFIRMGKTMKLSDAMNTITGSFHTGVIEGNKPKPASFEYEVPYLDKTLKGKELLEQLNKWAAYGTIDPECRDAIAAVAQHPEWLDLSDKYFVLLGAGSAMGPLLVLLAHGANVVAVDLDRAPVWERLIGLARNSPGRLIFPLKKPQDTLKTDADLFANAGCNLFTQTPEIKNWLLEVEPGKELIIGGYAYMDAALFVKVAMAMDAIIKGVLEKRKNAGLAFLCSPTDVFVTSEDSRKAAIKSLSQATWWQRLISGLSGGRFLVSNVRPQVTSVDNKKYSIVDGLVVAQGPNYALAKRLQHWRCMLAWSNGHLVSTNIAPSTATRSVVNNKQFAAAYGGMPHFKPMEVMYQETSNAVMGAILIHDVRNPKAFANPQNGLKLAPVDIFRGAPFHGGIWRMAYKMNSIGEIAASIYYLKQYKVAVIGVLGGLAALVGTLVSKGAPHTW